MRTRRIVIVASFVAATALCPAPGRAQGPKMGGEQRVRDAVEAFLLHLGNHDLDRVAADLAPKCIVIVVSQRNGQWSNSYRTGEEWQAALKANPNPVMFREPLTNVRVTIDSNQLAYLRADFQVLRGGKPQSRGVDEFTLTNENGTWRIAAIAYTSMPVR